MDDRDLIALGKRTAALSSRPEMLTPLWQPWWQSPTSTIFPTMTGGVGHDQLKRFYKYNFVGVNPPDFGAHAN
jgi:carboxymethylenebutenolidase